MEKIICDPFMESESKRFMAGLKMGVITTGHEKLFAPSYEVYTLTCCSSVRSTSSNWFYLIPNLIDLNLLKKWLDEITSIFSNLQIQIVTTEPKRLTYRDDNSFNLLSLNQTGEDGRIILLPIEISERSNGVYGITNRNSFQTGSLSNIGFLIEAFCDYCTENKIEVFVDYRSIVEDFIIKNRETFSTKNLLISPVTVHVGSGAYEVQCGHIVDFEDISDEALIDYVSRIFVANRVLMTPYIQQKIRTAISKTNDIRFLQVLYSKKTSNIQAYLAHHLIRAGFSGEFHSFINQYFIIKEHLPDIGFWNRILYTQFGFRYYYYYWLTDQRTFRTVSDEEMARLIKTSSLNSSKEFLSSFYSDMSLATKTRASVLYTSGDFIRFDQLMKGSVLVQLLPTATKRFTNLRLSPDYTVTSDDDKYYFIIGDDYKLRRYSKKHFKTLGT